MTHTTLKLLASATLGLATVIPLVSCSTNATTGRSQFAYYSREEEIDLGSKAQPELTAEFGGAVNNDALTSYIAGVGRSLAAVTEAENPSLPWEFTLLDSPVINAFALPGGKVFMSRGLADKLTNEAQLAAVLGHECGHVTARHTNDRMTQQVILVGGGSLLGNVAGSVLGQGELGAQAGQTIGGIAALSYSRKQEIEADQLGVRYMEKLKYDPAGAVEVQEILKAASGGSSQPEILATHPASDTRINALQERIKKEYQFTVGNPAYQKFADRYQQRYLSIASKLPPPKAAPAPAPKAQIDHNRSQSMLASVILADPTTWCGHCRQNQIAAGAMR
ncbi:MAG: M48 family metallopeptidase [Pyrinomonadaceae bacterium]|nr:M48 family metallopeptidase [Phycisphaerales bacterium]